MTCCVSSQENLGASLFSWVWDGKQLSCDNDMIRGAEQLWLAVMLNRAGWWWCPEERWVSLALPQAHHEGKWHCCFALGARQACHIPSMS